MLLTLIRHGAVEGRPYVLRGRSDPPLSKDGWKQLEHAAQALETPRIDRLYTSPSVRCQAFAHTWSVARQIECTVMSALREIDFGRWEEHSLNEARAQDGECFYAMTTDLDHWRAPDGEAYREFHTRVLQAFDDISHTHSDHVGVLTHAGVMRVLLCQILGMRPERAQSIAIDYGCSCRVWFEDIQHARLLFLNNL